MMKGEKNIRCWWFTIKYNRPYVIQKIKRLKFNKIYGGPPLNMVHFRYLTLKINGEDQNGKRQKSYGTKLRQFKVRGPK